MDEDRLRVLIVDDHAVVQWGFKVLLGRQRWVERCVVASDPEEALTAAERLKPHVALVDLFLGERSGAELCEAIRGVSPKTRVLLISGSAGSRRRRRRPPAPPGSSPRTGAPTRSRWRCAWSARG